MGFPFTFFRHGAVNLDAKLKNAETYVVFTRDPTAAERLAIEGSCPAPVAGMFTWGDRFAYFGSAGDTFDFEVLEQFGGPEIAKLFAANDFKEAMKKMDFAMAEFVKAYDEWLEDAHAKVPIAFAEAPTSTMEDAWGEWSKTRVDEALAALAPIRSKQKELKWIATRVNEMLEDAPVDASKTQVRATAAIAQLEGVELDVPIGRLTITEQEIHTAGQALGAVLGKMPKGKRAALLASLSPKAKLVYYASYTALRNGDLAALGDAGKALDEIVAGVSDHEHWRTAQLVAFIAENLAHTTPAFEDPDPKGAKAALHVFQTAIAMGARDEQTFDYAMTCARAARNKHALLAFANDGIDATRSPTLANRAAKHARAFKDTKAARAFEARSKAIMASSTIAQRGDVAKMHERLESGIEPTTDLLGNLAVLWGNDKKADEKAVEKLVARLAETLLAEPAFGMNRAVALNFGVCGGNHGHSDKVVDVLDELFERGLPFAAQLVLAFSYSGSVSKKDATKRKVLARLAKSDTDDVEALAYENFAEIHMALGDHTGAIASLARAKDLRHPRFASMRKEKSFAPLVGNADFEALFA
jgi:hypothetical protein